MIFDVIGSVGFVLVRRVLGLLRVGPAPDGKDVEIAVLRHQLMVLRRQVARRDPPLAPLQRRPVEHHRLGDLQAQLIGGMASLGPTSPPAAPSWSPLHGPSGSASATATAECPANSQVTGLY